MLVDHVQRLPTAHCNLLSLLPSTDGIMHPMWSAVYSGNSTLTRCNLFSSAPSTDGIMHPIWGDLLSPATRTPLSNSPPTLACCNRFSLSCPQNLPASSHVTPPRIGSALFSMATTLIACPQLQSLLFPALKCRVSSNHFSPPLVFPFRRELFPPHMGCPFQSGNSTRCKLFSRAPSTDGIMHPIWGALLSPTTRPCHG